MSDLTLPNEDLSSTEKFEDAVHLKKGQILFAEGESSAYLYIIVKGKIRVVKESESRLIPISIIGNKSFIGELSMFSDEPRSATAVAEENSDVLMIKKSEIRKVIKSCPSWVSDIMKTLSERLRSGIDIMREHKIEDDEFKIGDELTTEHANEIIENIKAYRERRGLN